MKNAEINTNLLEIKLLEIAVRASGADSQSSTEFVKELGISEIVQKIKDEHPQLASKLTGGTHSADWNEGFDQACTLLAILGELTSNMLDHFGEEDSPTGSEFTVADWMRELTMTAKRLVPEVAGCSLTPEKSNVDA